MSIGSSYKNHDSGQSIFLTFMPRSFPPHTHLAYTDGKSRHIKSTCLCSGGTIVWVFVSKDKSNFDFNHYVTLLDFWFSKVREVRHACCCFSIHTCAPKGLTGAAWTTQLLHERVSCFSLSVIDNDCEHMVTQMH